MSQGTKIEWTDCTWNPVVGCSRASHGCNSCYAVTMTHRLEAMGKARYAGLTVLAPDGRRHFNGIVRTVPEVLQVPLRWKRPRRIFVNSMSDLFHARVPFEFVAEVFAVMAWSNWHTYQVLTKRPERAYEFFAWLRQTSYGDPLNYLIDVGRQIIPEHTRILCATRNANSPSWPLPNVWLGTSVEDQEAADERIPNLLRCPAAVRFLSCEPLLGPVDLRNVPMWWTSDTGALQEGEHPVSGIDWVIVGGESGSRARCTGLGWIRDLVKQCQAANVPVFVKQVGSWVASGGSMVERPRNKGGNPEDWPEDLRVRQWPKGGVR